MCCGASPTNHSCPESPPSLQSTLPIASIFTVVPPFGTVNPPPTLFGPSGASCCSCHHPGDLERHSSVQPAVCMSPVSTVPSRECCATMDLVRPTLRAETFDFSHDTCPWVTRFCQNRPVYKKIMFGHIAHLESFHFEKERVPGLASWTRESYGQKPFPISRAKPGS